ncbi:DNA-binding response regulator [Paenibacillus albidus]|uniref:Heme response regulator HssR n=1 Tax=Paenibacillus albidus TaxID=2041023 RepID=A0A917CB02_9BACL|nr:response regulator transcription factor [Paenibacillus albidus]MBT2288855.1 response regulator transcription factor [Paenibacillus albidus]GGF79030.1 DNA-binding response regulator [Paenibacillus albidus]
MTTILVVDDDTHIRELVGLLLKDEGMEIVEQTNGLEAWDYYEHHSVDLVIVDIMMPEMDGWELCRRLRAAGDTPVLMITARNASADKIKGFQLGTDDYLIKPFDPIEMVMRVKALLKRYRIATSQTLTLGRVTLDKRSYQVFLSDTDAYWTLPLKEFELLYRLASYPGQIFTRDMLICDLWGYGYDGDERTVYTHINRLRDRFQEYTEDFRIVTMRGMGYRLEVYCD